MKKIILMITMLLGISTTIFAKTIAVSYSGIPITKTINLSKGDVVMINTTVPVGTRLLIKVKPTTQIINDSFTFISSMENFSPTRNGPFVDQMYTGASPGWVSYTYTGENAIQVKFKLGPY